MAIWNAKRNTEGDTTKDLFNGFDTITATEATAGNIAADKGNYMELAAAIDKTNAIDTFNAIYAAADDELQGQKAKIYVPYNTEFKKTFLEGTDNQWEFCPLASKKGSQYIHIAPQSNMVYGYGAGDNPGERLAIEKYSSWKLTLEAAMAFGVQFRSLSPEMLMVAKLKGE